MVKFYPVYPSQAVLSVLFFFLLFCRLMSEQPPAGPSRFRPELHATHVVCTVNQFLFSPCPDNKTESYNNLHESLFYCTDNTTMMYIWIPYSYYNKYLY